MNRRLNLKLVSFILGFILWIYVNLVVPPTIRRTIRIRAEYRNIPQTMRITPQQPEVEIVLSGTRRDFIFAGSDPAQAFIDMQNLQPGKAIMQVRVSTHSGLSVASIRPTQLELFAERLFRKEFEVKVETVGFPADGYVAETPVVKPKTVVIEGTRDLVEKVTGCFATISLRDVTNSISEGLPVKLVPQLKELGRLINVLPERVDVSIAIKEGFPQKTVPIGEPVFVPKSLEGLAVKGTVFSPNSVPISGPYSILNQINQIQMQPMDLTGLAGPATVTVTLLSPSDRVGFAGTSTVSLFLDLKPVKIKRMLSGLPVTLKKSPNQHCVLAIASYSITLEGFIDKLNRIMPADLEMTLDTRQMAPGSFSVLLPAPTGIPQEVSILEISPASTAIEISEIVQDGE